MSMLSRLYTSFPTKNEKKKKTSWSIMMHKLNCSPIRYAIIIIKLSYFWSFAWFVVRLNVGNERNKVYNICSCLGLCLYIFVCIPMIIECKYFLAGLTVCDSLLYYRLDTSPECLQNAIWNNDALKTYKAFCIAFSPIHDP